jgi:DNA repair ATPase RecN
MSKRATNETDQSSQKKPKNELPETEKSRVEMNKFITFNEELKVELEKLIDKYDVHYNAMIPESENSPYKIDDFLKLHESLCQLSPKIREFQNIVSKDAKSMERLRQALCQHDWVKDRNDVDNSQTWTCSKCGADK